jgi:hypothetical protein
MTALFPLPLRYEGDGQFSTPPGFRKRADREYVIGEAYRMEPIEERLAARHRAYFAQLKDCFDNLPEEHAEQFPTSEALRNYALIRTGYRDEQTHVCASAAEAARTAILARALAPMSVVVVKGSIVTIWSAKSQAFRAMDKETFNASADAVLAYAASLIGVAPEVVAQNAGRAA